MKKILHVNVMNPKPFLYDHLAIVLHQFCIAMLTSGFCTALLVFHEQLLGNVHQSKEPMM